MPSTPAMAKNTNDVTIMRMPMTEWLTAARRCNPGPVAQIADSCRCSRNALPPCAPVVRVRSFFLRPSGAAACVSAAEKSSGRWTMTIEAHARVVRGRRTRCRSFVAAGLVGLNAQPVHVPGTASILPARRGTQKAWMTSWLVTTMSTGVPAGRCRTFRVSTPP